MWRTHLGHSGCVSLVSSITISMGKLSQLHVNTKKLKDPVQAAAVGAEQQRDSVVCGVLVPTDIQPVRNRSASWTGASWRR